MKKSFTMVELLVVIAVIGILAGILVPVLGTATQKARVTQARADINALMTAIKSYESNYNALPCAYNKNRDVYTTKGKKGFAKEDNYLFWHEYAADGNTNDAKSYDIFVQEMAQVDMINASSDDKITQVENQVSDGDQRYYNSRGIKLLEVGQKFPNKGFVDPWGNRYAIIINDGYAKNGIFFEQESLSGKPGKKLIGDFFVYSFGPNMVDDYGVPVEETPEDRDCDDINSWSVQ